MWTFIWDECEENGSHESRLLGDLTTKRISSSTPGLRVSSDTTKTVRTRRYSGEIEAVQYGISEMRG